MAGKEKEKPAEKPAMANRVETKPSGRRLWSREDPKEGRGGYSRRQKQAEQASAGKAVKVGTDTGIDMDALRQVQVSEGGWKFVRETGGRGGGTWSPASSS